MAGSPRAQRGGAWALGVAALHRSGALALEVVRGLFDVTRPPFLVGMSAGPLGTRDLNGRARLCAYSPVTQAAVGQWDVSSGATMHWASALFLQSSLRVYEIWGSRSCLNHLK